MCCGRLAICFLGIITIPVGTGWIHNKHVSRGYNPKTRREYLLLLVLEKAHIQTITVARTHGAGNRVRLLKYNSQMLNDRLNVKCRSMENIPWRTGIEALRKIAKSQPRTRNILCVYEICVRKSFARRRLKIWKWEEAGVIEGKQTTREREMIRVAR